jgi:hypothetical protein
MGDKRGGIWAWRWHGGISGAANQRRDMRPSRIELKI